MKNKIYTIFTTLFVSLICLSSQAANKYNKIILISDIDDTIKVSHILAGTDKIIRATNVTTPFAGMAHLFQLVLNANHQSENKIVYLSNAPKEVLGIPALQVSHQTFLKYNQFPPGELNLRDSLFEENHKIKEIRRIIDSEKPDAVIMIGDNGERDAEIYHQAVQEYSRTGIKMVTFIHQLYGSKVPFYKPNILAEIGKTLYPEQYGYVTPVEIALQLKDEDLIDQAGLDWMLKNISPYIVKESYLKIDLMKPLTFPRFKNCSDFQWRWSQSNAAITLPADEKVLLNAVIQKIKAECK